MQEYYVKCRTSIHYYYPHHPDAAMLSSLVGGTIVVPRWGAGLVGDTEVASIEVAQRG